MSQDVAKLKTAGEVKQESAKQNDTATVAEAATAGSEDKRATAAEQVECNCEFCETCSFFDDRLFVLPDLAAQVRAHFCYQYSYRCARYILRKLTGKGDPNLLPSDLREVADKLGWNL